jgi:hypothetical protein
MFNKHRIKHAGTSYRAPYELIAGSTPLQWRVFVDAEEDRATRGAAICALVARSQQRRADSGDHRSHGAHPTRVPWRLRNLVYRVRIVP